MSVPIQLPLNAIGFDMTLYESISVPTVNTNSINLNGTTYTNILGGTNGVTGPTGATGPTGPTGTSSRNSATVGSTSVTSVANCTVNSSNFTPPVYDSLRSETEYVAIVTVTPTALGSTCQFNVVFNTFATAQAVTTKWTSAQGTYIPMTAGNASNIMSISATRMTSASTTTFSTVVSFFPSTTTAHTIRIKATI